jgi:hypothetical protein
VARAAASLPFRLADGREQQQVALDDGLVDGGAEELQSAIEVTLQRFAEYQNLQGAFGRRAVIEQSPYAGRRSATAPC